MLISELGQNQFGLGYMSNEWAALDKPSRQRDRAE